MHELICLDPLVGEEAAILKVHVEMVVVPSVDIGHNAPKSKYSPEELLNRDTCAAYLLVLGNGGL
jgi:hypothetical protein